MLSILSQHNVLYWLMKSISIFKSSEYATSISKYCSLTRLQASRTSAALRKKWEELEIPFELKVIETPYRDIIYG